MTDETATPRPPVALGVWAMGALALLLHVVTANGYGIFRDELYYIACSKELALGYVDQPPFSIVLLAAWRAIFGESLFALRLPPGLAHAATAVVFGFIARELGAARFGQSLAALLAALLPVYLGTSSFYSMNAFDVLFWALLIFVLCRIIATQNAKLWLLFGVIAGLGVQNKFSVAFLAIALAAGIVLTMQWKYLRSPYPYIGGAIAFLIFLPHVYWMHSTDWVTLEFMRNASSMKNAATNPLKYFLDQLLMAHPLYLPIWIAGIVYLFRAQSLRAYRIYAVMFVFLFFFFSLTNGKSYYLAPAYSLVLPAGALAIERFAQRRGAWFRPAALALAALAGLIIAPMAVPLLSPEGILRYEQALGLKPPRDEKGHDAALG
ncbi:MAG TPA: glycosyltransferase family 39 protein, partial [Candidatus Hydrogenedentes bacterium]|nr:glycosyltransferase family 39 protein [Candidatus Hydrogenedentota bacterium]